MMSSHPRWFWAVIAVVVSGCSYPFSGDKNFVEVPQPSPSPNATITLENVSDGDTLLINQPTLLKYQIGGIDMSLASNVQFKLDEKIFALPSTVVKGSYLFVPDPGLSDYFILKLQVITSAGNGSLTDHLGLVSILYEKSWVIRIET